MTRRFARLLALLVAALAIQVTPGVARWGLDLPLLFVALLGLRMPLLEAAAWGAVAGLGQDLLSSCGVGPHVAAKMIVGMSAHAFRTLVYQERVLTQSALVAACMLLQQLLLWGYFAALGVAPAPAQVMALLGRSVGLTALAGVAASWCLVRLRRQYNDPATA